MNPLREYFAEELSRPVAQAEMYTPTKKMRSEI